MARLTGLGLSEEEAMQRERQKEASRLAAECRRCEAWRDKVIAQSKPVVPSCTRSAVGRNPCFDP